MEYPDELKYKYADAYIAWANENKVDDYSDHWEEFFEETPYGDDYKMDDYNDGIKSGLSNNQ